MTLREEKIQMNAEQGIWEEYTSRNGISMIKGLSMDWEKSYQYYDNTGPWSLLIRVGGFTDSKSFMWKVNEDKSLSVYDENSGCSFRALTLEQAEFFILSYLVQNKLDLPSLYIKCEE